MILPTLQKRRLIRKIIFPQGCVQRRDAPENLSLFYCFLERAQWNSPDRRPFTFQGDMPEASFEPAAAKPIELRSTYLLGALFDDLYLGDAIFNNVCLSNATIADANLSGTSIRMSCPSRTAVSTVSPSMGWILPR